MKNNFKRLLSLLLSVAMVLGVSVFSVNATETTPTTGSITIKTTETGHVYEAYQIFSGALTVDDEGTKTLTSIQWGNGVNSSQLSGVNAEDKSKTLTADNAETFAKEMIQYLSDTGKVTLSGVTGGYSATNLPVGYYLVMDQKDSLANQDKAYTTYILQVVGDVEVTPKSDQSSVVKKVKDKDDTTGTETDWQDSADYDINDSVPFQLTATLADNVTSYNAYPIVFTDTLSKGLTYDAGSVKVYLGSVSESNDITKFFSLQKSEGTDGATVLKIFTKDAIKAGAGNDSKIIVEYTATLNDKAVIGSTGNPNKVDLSYANNPNTTYPEFESGYDGKTPSAGEDGTPGEPNGGDDSDGSDETGGTEPSDSLGKTPEDTVKVFTYKVQITKVDGSNNPLAGATFTLEKKDKEGNYVAVSSDKLTVTGEKSHIFTFTGLDDGTYRLSETAPSGYNPITPIEFVIAATHDVTADDPKLTALSGDKITGDTTATFLTRDTDDTLKTDIVNNKGANLPETGGMGTRLFYILGGLLVLAASVLLITKRRMSKF
jgi:fimbrial isopeptide formation D2 family protein/LPXTG-motif cell wall-anchored protein